MLKPMNKSTAVSAFLNRSACGLAEQTRRENEGSREHEQLPGLPSAGQAIHARNTTK